MKNNILGFEDVEILPTKNKPYVEFMCNNIIYRITAEDFNLKIEEIGGFIPRGE